MKRSHIVPALLASACIALMPLNANASTLELPSGTVTVQEEAFAGDTSVTEVILPEGSTAIEKKAFADCTSLRSITIPGSVTSIATDALSNNSKGLLIKTSAGSTAMAYARANGIDYQADTKYYALVVVNADYSGTEYDLTSPIGDKQIMNTLLGAMPGTPYKITNRTDQTATQILSAISTAFASAREQDVCLFYYSGHGYKGGKLAGVDFTSVEIDTLQSALDSIPARKVLIADCCYSGALIGKSMDITVEEESTNSFAADFVAAFADPRRTIDQNNYYVLAASRGLQKSYGMESGSSGYGLLTYNLGLAYGYDYKKKTWSAAAGDTDNNTVLTLAELYTYVADKVAAIATANNVSQDPQVWPEACTAFAPLRK